MFSKSCVALDLNWKLLAGLLLPYLQLNFLIIQPLIASLLPCQVLSPLMLLLVAILKHLFIGRRWVVAVGRRWRIVHHLMRRARLGWVHRVCQGDPWVPNCHSIYPKALHTSWLLGHCNGDKKHCHLVRNLLLLVIHSYTNFYYINSTLI